MKAGLIEFSPLTTYMGTNVSGIDLQEPIDKETEKLLVEKYHEFGVLKLSKQSMSEGQLMAFAKIFGDLGQTDGHVLDDHKFEEGGGQLLYMDLDNINTMASVTRIWHSDYSFRKTKCIDAVILYANEADVVGAETLICDMRSVYDSLSAPMKGYLNKLAVAHDSSVIKRYYLQDGVLTPEEYARSCQNMERSIWPMVCEITQSRRKYLYTNPRHTDHIVDVSPEESTSILSYLYKSAIDSDFIYSHSWSKGDVLIFNNKTCMHRVVPNYFGKRCLWKVTSYGAEPIKAVFDSVS